MISSLSSVEKREAELKKMLSTVLKDKQKIEDTIEELDRYKLEALQKTWEKVNGCVVQLFLLYIFESLDSTIFALRWVGKTRH